MRVGCRGFAGAIGRVCVIRWRLTLILSRILHSLPRFLVFAVFCWHD